MAKKDKIMKKDFFDYRSNIPLEYFFLIENIIYFFIKININILIIKLYIRSFNVNLFYFLFGISIIWPFFKETTLFNIKNIWNNSPTLL